MAELGAPDGQRPVPRPGGLFRGKRLLGAVAAGVVTAAFAGIVWHAYDLGRQDATLDTVPLIEAAEGPPRARPDDPGGMEVPHQDKLIYNQLTPGAPNEPVESLLPPPEEPMVPKIAPEPAESPAALPAGSPGESDVARHPVLPPRNGPATPPAEPKKTATAGTPPLERDENDDPAAGVPMPPAPASKAEAPTNAQPTAGTARIQLSSLRSRDAAMVEWNKLKAAHGALFAGLSPHVERAEIPGKGTFFRLQADGPADKAAADALCARFKAAGLGCLSVQKR